MEIKSIRHVGVVTENIEKSVTFYQNILGMVIFEDSIHDHFSLNKVMRTKNTKIRIVRLKCKKKETTLELLKWISPKSPQKKKINSIGITHFAVNVNNINLIYKKLRKNKYKILSKPQLAYKKKVKYMFCISPENTYIEFVEKQ